MVEVDLDFPDMTVIDECLTELKDDRPFVLAIDGRDGAGKTALGLYLALSSGRLLFDADLVLRATKTPTYTKDLGRIVARRRAVHKPLIVSGIFIGRSLKDSGYQADFLVRVIRTECDGNDTWSHDFDTYERQHIPKTTLYLPCHGSDKCDKQCFMLKKEPSGQNDGVSACTHCRVQSDRTKRTDTPWY